MEANGETERGRPPRDRAEGNGWAHPRRKGWRDPPLPSSQALLRPQTSAPYPPQPFPSSSSPTRPQASLLLCATQLPGQAGGVTSH